MQPAALTTSFILEPTTRISLLPPLARLGAVVFFAMSIPSSWLAPNKAHRRFWSILRTEQSNASEKLRPIVPGEIAAHDGERSQRPGGEKSERPLRPALR